MNATLKSTRARLRSLRPPKPEVDVWRPLGAELEQERRRLDDRWTLVSSSTLLLAGSECPYTCVFCDLFQYTIDGPTPEGAIPKQIELGLELLVREDGELPSQIKLYNASNFFDPRAVPEADYERIAAQLEPFERVVVESHARLLGDRCRRFAGLLSGRLEVGLGVETVNEPVLARLNKGVTLADLDRAFDWLRREGIDARAFVLLAAPSQELAAEVEWVVRSIDFALSRGARVVSVVPVRDGNGEMERLRALGEWQPPTLDRVETVASRVVGELRGTVQIDPWDLARLESCTHCTPQRLERLHRANLRGAWRCLAPCGACGFAGEP